MTIRQAKLHLKKMLSKFCNGLSSSSKYQILKEAKTFAEDNNIPFPDDSQEDLKMAAREYLVNYIEFRNGGGVL